MAPLPGISPSTVGKVASSFVATNRGAGAHGAAGDAHAVVVEVAVVADDDRVDRRGVGLGVGARGGADGGDRLPHAGAPGDEDLLVSGAAGWRRPGGSTRPLPSRDAEPGELGLLLGDGRPGVVGDEHHRDPGGPEPVDGVGRARDGLGRSPDHPVEVEGDSRRRWHRRSLAVAPIAVLELLTFASAAAAS